MYINIQHSWSRVRPKLHVSQMLRSTASNKRSVFRFGLSNNTRKTISLRERFALIYSVLNFRNSTEFLKSNECFHIHGTHFSTSVNLSKTRVICFFWSKPFWNFCIDGWPCWRYRHVSTRIFYSLYRRKTPFCRIFHFTEILIDHPEFRSDN